MSDHRSVWGERVAEARKAKRLSRAELAVKAGLSYATIVSIEQGRRGARDDVRLRIAAALDADVNLIFAYPEVAA